MMRGEEFQNWMQEIEQVRPQIDAMVATLTNYGASSVSPHFNEFGKMPSGELPYQIQFSNPEGAVTTLRIVLKDHNSPTSDLVITNMTTLPDNQKGKGYGSAAISSLLQWAKDNRMKELRATQVSNPDSERFWEKNGFVATGNHLGDYLILLDS
jgi:hypothetical protein